jgi:hypothetical protein
MTMVKRGDVEFRIPATPLSILVCAHTIKEIGIAARKAPSRMNSLQRRAKGRSGERVASSTKRRKAAAIPVLPRATVNTGMSRSANSTNKKEQPQRTERVPSNSHSRMPIWSGADLPSTALPMSRPNVRDDVH